MSLIVKFACYSVQWGLSKNFLVWLENPLFARCNEYNFNLHFAFVTEVSRDFDKVLCLLILERLEPPYLDNRYNFWRVIDKVLLSRQRLFCLWLFTGYNIMLGIISVWLLDLKKSLYLQWLLQNYIRCNIRTTKKVLLFKNY